MVNSSEILAGVARDLFNRLPKPINFALLTDQQIAPAIIQAIRVMAAHPEIIITADDISRFERDGGTDHCDPTLTGSPIASERPYQTTILR